MLALTTGEPAGIGPELALMLAREPLPAPIVLLGDAQLLRERAAAIGCAVGLVDYPATAQPGELAVLNVPLARRSQPGHLDPANAQYVLSLLDHAVRGCQSGEFRAMVTAPVHKGVINDAGIAFTGHTEYLAQKTGVADVVMMLVGGGMRVALATTHLPLSAVPAAITHEGLTRTIEIILHDLRARFGLEKPRILVAGLNPHAGEGGHMGREEIEVITPVLDALRARGEALQGPLPADTLFTPDRLQHADCALAMYHDQGLAVLKYASFGRGVNITLGLPIVRTSVDHGTALDLAGSGRADHGSLLEALRLAAQLSTPAPVSAVH